MSVNGRWHGLPDKNYHACAWKLEPIPLENTMVFRDRRGFNLNRKENVGLDKTKENKRNIKDKIREYRYCDRCYTVLNRFALNSWRETCFSTSPLLLNSMKMWKTLEQKNIVSVSIFCRWFVHSYIPCDLSAKLFIWVFVDVFLRKSLDGSVTPLLLHMMKKMNKYV